MPSTKQQRARRQTAPSGPPRKPTASETQGSLLVVEEKSPGSLEWKAPGWNNELEFSQWLNGVKDDLIEDSYDEYQYDRHWMTIGASLTVAFLGIAWMSSNIRKTISMKS